jgi:NitT/TauT family transport system ATP-binding protein
MPDTNASDIDVRGIAKSYPDGSVLSDLNVQLPAAKITALMGPSGCGKTTLLHILAGLEKPDQGEVLGRGTVSVVFQQPGLFPWRTVNENVAFGLEKLGVNKNERVRRAEAMLNRVHLGKYIGAYPYQLSGGMQQRVAVARALVLQPDLLLLDEPFGALDEETREQMQHLLLNLYEEQPRTIGIVTHSVEEGLLLADNVVVFSARPGRILAEFTLPKRTVAQKINAERYPDTIRHEIRVLLGREVQKLAEEGLNWDI